VASAYDAKDTGMRECQDLIAWVSTDSSVCRQCATQKTPEYVDAEFVLRGCSRIVWGGHE